MSRSLEGGFSATLFTTLESRSSCGVPYVDQSQTYLPSDDSHQRHGACRNRRQLRLLVVTGVALLAAASSAGALVAFSSVVSFGRWRSAAATLDSSRLDDTIAAQLLAVTGPSANACGALDDDIDFEYTNVAGLGHLDNIVSSQDCCTLCQGEPTCKAFTWVKDAHLLVGNPGQCWLKGGGFIKKNAKKGVYSAFVRDDQLAARFAKEEKSAHQKEARGGSEGNTAKLATSTTVLEDTTTTAEKARLNTNTSAARPSTTVAPVTTTAASTTSTRPTTSTAPSTRPLTTSNPACCSFEPFTGCGHVLNISSFCDISRSHCERQCAGRWLPMGAGQRTGGLDVHPPTRLAKPAAPPPRKDNNPCCSFAPLAACGDELAISKYCDVSKKRCQEECAGKWLEGGPKENPHGIDLYAEYVPSSSDA